MNNSAIVLPILLLCFGLNLSAQLSVSNFFNDTAGGPPNMGQFFTEELREYFQRNTKLELVQSQGDLQFEGAISSYDVRPQAVTARCSLGDRYVSSA